MALLLLAMLGAATADPKRVLLVHSLGFPPWEEYTKSIRKELGRQYQEPLDIYQASLAAAHVDESAEATFADYLRALLANHQPDLVVGVGAPAVGFFQRHRGQLFPSTTPMVLTGVDQGRIAFAALTANDSVVAGSFDLGGLFEKILRVLPETSNVAVVSGSSPVEKFYLEQIRTAFELFTGRVTFTWFDKLSFDDMLKRAAALPPRSAIIALYMDAADDTGAGRKAFSSLYAVANAPIFNYSGDYLGSGIVGGPASESTASEVGRLTASVAVRILRGEVSGTIKTPPIGFGALRFDWTEMQRWGISESLLPPGSEVRFRPPTAWEQYRWQIVMVAAALLAQMLLIAGLFYERRRRRYAEATRSSTAGELSASIAHEIRQPLGAIAANGSAALRWLKRATPDVGEAQAALERVVGEAHRASNVLGTIGSMFKKSDQERGALDVNIVVEEVLTLLHTESSAAKDFGQDSSARRPSRSRGKSRATAAGHLEFARQCC